jgi:hypothetical protein
MLHQHQDDAETEVDSGPDYVHSRPEGSFAHGLTESEPSSSQIYEVQDKPLSQEFPNDLTGIGSAYGVQDDDMRQAICTDEDLGLETTTGAVTIAAQNVVLPA